MDPREKTMHMQNFGGQKEYYGIFESGLFIQKN